jgi:hypothetical protein
VTQPGIDLFDDPPWNGESDDLEQYEAAGNAGAAIAGVFAVAVLAAAVMFVVMVAVGASLLQQLSF